MFGADLDRDGAVEAGVAGCDYGAGTRAFSSSNQLMTMLRYI